MHNTTLCFASAFLPSAPLAPLAPSPPPLLPPHGKHLAVMFVVRAFPYISFVLLLSHLTSVLLIKLFSFLRHRAISSLSVTVPEPPFFCSDDELCIPCREDEFFSAATVFDEVDQRHDTIADAVLGGEALLLLYSGSPEKDSLLADEGRDSKEHVFLRKDVAFVPDCVEDCVLPPVNVSHHVAFNAFDHSIEEKTMEAEVKKDRLMEDEQKEKQDFDTKSSKVVEAHQERVTFGGSGESTSNSSMEWRSSTIFRDSETEYPFSSSSRRSSSNWESYTMFKKYEEEMIYFDKISAQKLAETESFRSKNIRTRSIPKRLISKLMAKPKCASVWDPYQELESAYVAQVCLAWEVLDCNYNSFKRAKCSEDMDSSCCSSRLAQRFQQFQVLLQRFIENEPYEDGQRPEIYARTRLSSPKLLQVPEFLCDEENQEMDAMVSAAEFFSILEDAIQTFMNFLKADNKRLKDLIKSKKQGTVDHAHLRLLKKINKKKKVKLEEIGRRSKCWKKRKTNGQEAMEAFMAMVDLKVVSRVLRVRQISEEQLHWCEDKMSRVRVWDGKMKRDHSPLFFPVHS